MINRRIFITGDKKTFYNLLTVSQGTKGDLIFTFQHPEQTKFILFDPTLDKYPRILDSPGDGHLSAHESGQIHYTEHGEGRKANAQFVIKGAPIASSDKNELGVRHLFTIVIKEPINQPITTRPAFNRKSDDSIISSHGLKPCIIILFAIPLGVKNISFSANHHADYFNVPDDFGGIGTMDMRYHRVFWYAYSQKKLLRWPSINYVAYSDGALIPFFIATSDKVTSKMMFIEPSYELQDGGNELIIHLDTYSSSLSDN